jgi:hypothetical protein
MMVGFANIAKLIDAHEAGKTRTYSWRKVPTQTTASGIWFDLSLSPGNPNPNYYAATPLTSKRLTFTDDGGLYHGPAVSPSSKYLRRFTALTVTTTAVPLPIVLCDYLLYYPFIDMSVTDPQDMIQGQTVPRYTTGAGVQMMAVEVASQIGGSQFTVTYTNQDGVAGRVTPTVTCNTQVSTGTIITTAPATAGCAGPFLPLQQGDSGVRSVQQVTFLTGDVGLITIVLVKPLATTTIYDITAAAEKDWFVDSAALPEIKDDAYLNLICLPSGTLASVQMLGTIEVVWT